MSSKHDILAAVGTDSVGLLAGCIGDDSIRAIENGRGLKSSIALSDGLAVVTANSDTVYAFESCGFSLADHCLS